MSQRVIAKADARARCRRRRRCREDDVGFQGTEVQRIRNTLTPSMLAPDGLVWRLFIGPCARNAPATSLQTLPSSSILACQKNALAKMASARGAARGGAGSEERKFRPFPFCPAVSCHVSGRSDCPFGRGLVWQGRGCGWPIVVPASGSDGAASAHQPHSIQKEAAGGRVLAVLENDRQEWSTRGQKPTVGVLNSKATKYFVRRGEEVLKSDRLRVDTLRSGGEYFHQCGFAARCFLVSVAAQGVRKTKTYSFLPVFLGRRTEWMLGSTPPAAMVTLPSSLESSSSLRMASWMWRGTMRLFL